MAKTRLDALLVERGLFESRSRAAAAVLAGEVRLERGSGRPAKPGHLVADDVAVHVERGPRFVSRGGVKLANALDALELDPAGRQCLDVGASTGGFTDCLLERVAARDLRSETLPHVPDVAVLDLSFISLTKVLGAVLGCLATDRFDVLALVKPQFELGPERVSRGGVVREADHRRAALVSVARHAREQLGCT